MLSTIVGLFCPIVGLFCPYSRSILTLVWSAQVGSVEYKQNLDPSVPYLPPVCLVGMCKGQYGQAAPLLGGAQYDVFVKLNWYKYYMVVGVVAKTQQALERQALKSPHIVGLFCPYSRSLLTLILCTQALLRGNLRPHLRQAEGWHVPRAVHGTRYHHVHRSDLRLRQDPQGLPGRSLPSLCLENTFYREHIV